MLDWSRIGPRHGSIVKNLEQDEFHGSEGEHPADLGKIVLAVAPAEHPFGAMPGSLRVMEKRELHLPTNQVASRFQICIASMSELAEVDLLIIVNQAISTDRQHRVDGFVAIEPKEPCSHLCQMNSQRDGGIRKADLTKPVDTLFPSLFIVRVAVETIHP